MGKGLNLLNYLSCKHKRKKSLAWLQISLKKLPSRLARFCLICKSKNWSFFSLLAHKARSCCKLVICSDGEGAQSFRRSGFVKRIIGLIILWTDTASLPALTLMCGYEWCGDWKITCFGSSLNTIHIWTFWSWSREMEIKLEKTLDLVLQYYCNLYVCRPLQVKYSDGELPERRQCWSEAGGRKRRRHLHC